VAGDIDLLFRRRSIARLVEPAPAGEELRDVLRAGAAAPDHGELRPWKFVVLRGPAKDAFGEVLADAYLRRVKAADGEPVPAKLEKERTKLGRAPLVVVVCSVHQHNPKFPQFDQLGSAFAAAQNMCLAATALGYAAMWRTGDPAFDDNVKRAVGVDAHDAIVGFIYIGTPATGAEKPAHDPDLDGLVVEWAPASSN
jgi:nitroreductase